MQSLSGVFSLVDRLAFAGIGSAEPKPRLQVVELLRLVSSFGIVFFHMRPTYGAETAHAGLMIFLFLLTYFEARSTAIYVWPLAAKLMMPWGIWTALYSGVDLLRSHPQIDLSHGILAAVLRGPSPHLWFLPYAFLFCGGLRFLKTRCCPAALGLTAGAMALAIVIILPLMVGITSGMRHPFVEYWVASAPSLLGIALAFCPANGTFIVLIAAAVCVGHAANGSALGISYALAFVSVVAAIKAGDIPALNILKIQRLSRFSLGVYLVHPILTSFANAAGIPNGLPDAFLVFLMSLFATWVMSGRAMARIGGLRLVPRTP